jgi:hypothetical protein
VPLLPIRLPRKAQHQTRPQEKKKEGQKYHDGGGGAVVAGAGSDREESRGGGGLFRLLCFTLHYMAIELLVW